MRRFFRILRAAFAGVSLLLCAAAVGVWVRSYYVGDVMSRRAGDRVWGIKVRAGRLVVLRADFALPTSVFASDGAWPQEVAPADVPPPRPSDIYAGRWAFEVAGVAYATRTVAPADRDADLEWLGIRDYSVRLLVVHLAYPTALFALAPLAWSAGFVRRRRRERRRRVGLCKQCGYDLRASPGRCPECGAVPAR